MPEMDYRMLVGEEYEYFERYRDAYQRRRELWVLHQNFYSAIDVNCTVHGWQRAAGINCSKCKRMEMTENRSLRGPKQVRKV